MALLAGNLACGGTPGGSDGSIDRPADMPVEAHQDADEAPDGAGDVVADAESAAADSNDGPTLDGPPFDGPPLDGPPLDGFEADGSGSACLAPAATTVWVPSANLGPQVVSIAALSPTDVWAMAGSDLSRTQAVYHWDGSAWSLKLSPVGEPRSLWASSSSNVWVTTGDEVKQWDGSTWNDRQPLGFNWRVVGFWGTGPNDVWAIAGGDQARPANMIHWDGQAWTQRDPSLPRVPNITFSDVWGTGSDDVWLVGEMSGATNVVGFVRRWDGTAWTEPSLGDAGQLYYAVTGTSRRDVWLMGSSQAGERAWHYDGVAWTSYEAPRGETITRVWTGCPGELWLVAQSNWLYRFDGAAWTKYRPFGGTIVTVTGSGPADLWVGGAANFNHGVIAHRADDGPPACNNARLDPGEACEPPDLVTCSASCQIIPMCGNGIVEPSIGETCDPPNGTTCTSRCRIQTCGNGVIDANEACDPSAAGSLPCNQQCVLTTCGNAKLDQGEACDPPQSWSPGRGTTKYCGSDCLFHDICVDCHDMCDFAPEGFSACAQVHCVYGPYSPCGTF
jgi:hypothetical protein